MSDFPPDPWDNPAFSPAKRETLALSWRHLVPGRVAVLRAAGIPFVMGRREGYRIWDIDGQALMDFHLNGGTYNLGHRNPALLATLRAAFDTLDIGNHHFPSVERAHLAERLSALAPSKMPMTVFAAGGGEAVDVAIKSARRATGRRRIVTIDSGYHGATGLSGAAGNDDNARYFASDRPEDFIKVPFNDTDAIERALAGGDVAAVMIETIPATSGFPVPADGYLAQAAACARAHGALYIADEVQTGLGRTGTLWGVQQWGVEPDLMIIGKGLSGGLYPMAAVMMREPVGQWLHDNGWGHVSTFGGAEPGCRVARHVLEITADPATLGHARTIAAHLQQGLAGLAARYPVLRAVRARGLVMGLEMAGSDGGMRMMAALFRAGIWAIVAGFDPRVVQFKPGLLLTMAEADEALGRVETALAALA